MPQESPTPKEQLALTVPDARAGRKGAGSDPGPGRRPGSGLPGHLRAARRCRVLPGSGWWPGCCDKGETP